MLRVLSQTRLFRGKLASLVAMETSTTSSTTCTRPSPITTGQSWRSGWIHFKAADVRPVVLGF